MKKGLFLVTVVWSFALMGYAQNQKINIENLLSEIVRLEEIGDEVFTDSFYGGNYLFVFKNHVLIKEFGLRTDDKQIQVQLGKDKTALVCDAGHLFEHGPEYYLIFESIERKGNKLLVKLKSETQRKDRSDHLRYFSAELKYKVGKEWKLKRKRIEFFPTK